MINKIGNRLLVAGQTDVGCVRALNEDAFQIEPSAALLILADGMGGHDAGEVASAQVITTLCRELGQFLDSPLKEAKTIVIRAQETSDSDVTQVGDFYDEPTLDDIPNPVLDAVLESIARTNTELNNSNKAKGYSEESGMGSTLVALWLPDFSATPVVFHVGDSRLYLLRHHQLNQVTRDHSLYQQWVNFGSKGEPPGQNILLQAIGPSRHVTPDVGFLPIESGDVVLLCSDGLTGMVSDQNIQQILQTASPQNLDAVCESLITQAKKGGGRDNITVIVGWFL